MGKMNVKLMFNRVNYFEMLGKEGYIGNNLF